MLCGVSVVFNSLGDVAWIDELTSAAPENGQGACRLSIDGSL